MTNEIEKIDAVILCGGLGKRLKAVTGETPKVMAEFEGKPFLDILLQYLKQQGIRRAVLCTGYKSQEIEDYYKNNPQGMDIVISEEKEALGTGGAVKNAQNVIKSDSFFVSDDCWSIIDLRLLVPDYSPVLELFFRQK